jgi:hypothetical protein
MKRRPFNALALFSLLLAVTLTLAAALTPPARADAARVMTVTSWWLFFPTFD